MKKKSAAVEITNEKLVSKFDNLFDLVNFAIAFAEKKVRSGKGPSLYAETQNTATLVLQEIEKEKTNSSEISSI